MLSVLFGVAQDRDERVWEEGVQERERHDVMSGWNRWEGSGEMKEVRDLGALRRLFATKHHDEGKGCTVLMSCYLIP